MCHNILWYHALCLHVNPTASSVIHCPEATVCGGGGGDCLRTEQEQFYIPQLGLCGVCQKLMNRIRRSAKRRREKICADDFVVDPNADENWSWLYIVPDQPGKRKNKRQRRYGYQQQHHHHDRHLRYQGQHHQDDDLRSDGYSGDGEEDATIDQEQHHHRKSSVRPNTEEEKEEGEWDRASGPRTPDLVLSSSTTSPFSSKNDGSHPEPWTPPSAPAPAPSETKIRRIPRNPRIQRSCIPVPKSQILREADIAMNLQLETANTYLTSDDDGDEEGEDDVQREERQSNGSRNRYQRSCIPVRKNRFMRGERDTPVPEMRWQRRVGNEMELFDRVTF